MPNFTTFIKDYNAQKNLDNKALLILDSARGHPVNLEDLADNVQVVFLLSNMLLLQSTREWSQRLRHAAYVTP